MPSKTSTAAQARNLELDRRLIRFILDSKAGRHPTTSFREFCNQDKDFFGSFGKDQNSKAFKRRKKVANRYSKLVSKHENNLLSFIEVCESCGIEYSIKQRVIDSSDDSSATDCSQVTQDTEPEETHSKAKEEAFPSNVLSSFTEKMSILGSKLNQRLIRK